MSRWTKKDIKTMRQTLSTFWLMNRPLGNFSAHAWDAAGKAVRELMVANRSAIVISGIVELREIAAHRASEARKSYEHFSSHPEVYGRATSEMVTRFQEIERGHLSDVVSADRLIARIKRDGMPGEVSSFDPTVAGP